MLRQPAGLTAAIIDVRASPPRHWGHVCSAYKQQDDGTNICGAGALDDPACQWRMLPHRLEAFSKERVGREYIRDTDG